MDSAEFARFFVVVQNLVVKTYRMYVLLREFSFFFFFNDTPPTEIYTLPLHDALPICAARGDGRWSRRSPPPRPAPPAGRAGAPAAPRPTGTPGRSLRRHPRRALRRRARCRGSADRKSTRLNSSHGYISYAVFCLKKKT